MGSNPSELEAAQREIRVKWFRVTDDDGNGLELIDAEMSWYGQNDTQPTAFQPDNRGKRSEFSLHIGC